MPALLAVVGTPLGARAEDADHIVRASHDCVAATSVELQQTVEQTTRVLVPGKPAVVLPATKQTSVIEIDARNNLVRLTTKDGGQELVVIRKGNRVAMKIGAGPWTKPQGKYARVGAQFASPFACPLPKRGDKQSPKWTIVGRERLGGTETTVIETIGDTANKYAQERMREGLAAVFPDATARPTIEVEAYKSRLWIGKDRRRLRVEQTSRQKMTMPGGGKTVLDVSAKTTTVYRRYDKVEVRVPEEARGILEPR
jgi:hypothetical protein